MEKSKPKEILELEEVYGIKLEEQINDKIIKTNYFKLDENENIVEIILIGNKLENIKGFDKFEYLQYLSLGANKITKIENLDNLKNLTMLNLGYNNIEKIENLSNLKNLTTLILNNNQIKQCKHRYILLHT